MILGCWLAELELYIMLVWSDSMCSLFSSIWTHLHPQVSKNFKLCTQSLKKMQATIVKADELVKIKCTDRK